MNIIIEKDAVISDILNIIIINNIFQLINLDISKISLIVLIVGGADMLTAINKNHHIMMLGLIKISPLKCMILRV